MDLRWLGRRRTAMIFTVLANWWSREENSFKFGSSKRIGWWGSEVGLGIKVDFYFKKWNIDSQNPEISLIMLFLLCKRLFKSQDWSARSVHMSLWCFKTNMTGCRPSPVVAQTRLKTAGICVSDLIEHRASPYQLIARLITSLKSAPSVWF